MLYTENRDFDIGKGDKNPGPLAPIYLREGENDGTKIIGTIYDGPQPLNVSGYSVTFKMTNPAKMYVDVPGTIESAVDGKVSVVVNHDMTDYRGPVQVAYFELTKGNEIVTTNNVDIKVLASNDLDSSQRAKYQTTIDKLVEQLTELTRTFKDLDNIQVTYKAGSSGTTAPTGSYTSTIPTVGQGEFLWARIQVNYSNGTNQVFYMMARQGKDNVTWGVASGTTDGLMSSADKRKLDSINDLTTGINLLRGTRDFRAGTELYPGTTNRYLNGFNPTTNLTYTTDEQGFTVVSMSATGLTSPNYKQVLSSFVRGVNKGDELTISFEMKLDDWDTYSNRFCLVTGIYDLTTTINATNVSTTMLGIDNELRDGGWVKAVYHYTVPIDVNANEGFMATLMLVQNGSVHFKKLMAQYGHIENPVWSPAPADFSLEPVNDMTTGINRLRGTKEFRKGTKPYGTYVGHFKDGFNIASGYELYEDEDGFTVAHIKHTGTNWKNINSSCVPVNVGDIVTVSFDFKVDDVRDTTYSNGSILPGAIEYYGTNSTARIGYTDMNIAPSDMTDGEWKQCVFTFTVPQLSPVGELYAIVRLQLALGGSIYFRKLKLENGRIINPVYSLSPSDVALEPINDITTMPNLLKGSRDWYINPANSKDGFTYNASYWVVSKQPDDTNVITFNNRLSSASYLSTPIVKGIEKGQTYTLGYEVMFHENPGTINLFGYSHRNSSDVSKRSGAYSSSLLGTIELEKWYRVVFPITITDTVEPGDFLSMSIGLTNANLSIKPLCLYKGNIERPAWSANPSDLLHTSDLGTVVGLTEVRFGQLSCTNSNGGAIPAYGAQRTFEFSNPMVNTPKAIIFTPASGFPISADGARNACNVAVSAPLSLLTNKGGSVYVYNNSTSPVEAIFNYIAIR